MQEFLNYLTQQIETGRADTLALEAQGRKDDANFAKVRTNIYDICRTVSQVHLKRPGGESAVKALFARFQGEWSAALEKAKAHEETKDIVVEETKLAALADVMTHFEEAEKA